MWPTVGNMYISSHGRPDRSGVLGQGKERIKETLGCMAET